MYCTSRGKRGNRVQKREYQWANQRQLYAPSTPAHFEAKAAFDVSHQTVNSEVHVAHKFQEGRKSKKFYSARARCTASLGPCGGKTLPGKPTNRQCRRSFNRVAGNCTYKLVQSNRNSRQNLPTGATESNLSPYARGKEDARIPISGLPTWHGTRKGRIRPAIVHAKAVSLHNGGSDRMLSVRLFGQAFHSYQSAQAT